MVSKSKELGKPILILTSIGSTPFQFSRLTSHLNKVDKNRYKILNKFTSPFQFIDHIKKADKIIIHGGPVTIFLAVKYAKFIPLIIPRLSKYKEHVDDHQLFFIKYLRSRLPKDLKRYFVTKEKVGGIVDDYLNEKKIKNNLNLYLFSDKKGYLADKLSRYVSLSFPK